MKKMTFSFKPLAVTALVLTLIAGCSHTPKPTLYQQLGGSHSIENIVEGMIVKIGADQQLFHYFADANVSRFRSQLILHLCAVSNGPCVYQGDSMEDIHTGMHITEKDFNHLVQLLVDVMSEQDVATTAQNRLLAKLAPMRSSIIER